MENKKIENENSLTLKKLYTEANNEVRHRPDSTERSTLQKEEEPVTERELTKEEMAQINDYPNYLQSVVWAMMKDPQYSIEDINEEIRRWNCML